MQDYEFKTNAVI